MEAKWEKKVIEKLFAELFKTLKVIAENPEIYPVASSKKAIRKCIIRKKTVLIYKINSDKNILLLVFADTRQNPNKYKI